MSFNDTSEIVNPRDLYSTVDSGLTVSKVDEGTQIYVDGMRKGLALPTAGGGKSVETPLFALLKPEFVPTEETPHPIQPNGIALIHGSNNPVFWTALGQVMSGIEIPPELPLSDLIQRLPHSVAAISEIQFMNFLRDPLENLPPPDEAKLIVLSKEEPREAVLVVDCEQKKTLLQEKSSPIKEGHIRVGTIGLGPMVMRRDVEGDIPSWLMTKWQITGSAASNLALMVYSSHSAEIVSKNAERRRETNGDLPAIQFREIGIAT